MKRIIIIIFLVIIWMISSEFFFDTTSTSMHPVVYLQKGSADAQDYNGDGLLDLITGGLTVSESPILLLYHHNATGGFYSVTNAVTFPDGLPQGFFYGRVAFVDVDGNGIVDFFYAGMVDMKNFVHVTALFVQKGLGVFSDASSIFFPNNGLVQTGMAFFDFSPAEKDLLLIGYNINTTYYHFNQSSQTFVDVTSVAFAGAGIVRPYVSFGNVLWSPTPFNGELSCFLLLGVYYAKIYRQNTSGLFFDITNGETFPGLYFWLFGAYAPSSRWADVDSNGLQDFFFTSYYYGPFFMLQEEPEKFYNIFFYRSTKQTEYQLGFGMVDFVDFNGDGRLDLLYGGYAVHEGMSNIYLFYQLPNATYDWTVESLASLLPPAVQLTGI